MRVREREQGETQLRAAVRTFPSLTRPLISIAPWSAAHVASTCSSDCAGGGVAADTAALGCGSTASAHAKHACTVRRRLGESACVSRISGASSASASGLKVICLGCFTCTSRPPPEYVPAPVVSPMVTTWRERTLTV